jgi:hypothetical protein
MIAQEKKRRRLFPCSVSPRLRLLTAAWTEFQQVAGLAVKRTAELFQYISAEHFGFAVAKTHQGRITNAGFLSEAVQCPSLSAQQLSKVGNDHLRIMLCVSLLVQVIIIYRLYFTNARLYARLAAGKARCTRHSQGIARPFQGESIGYSNSHLPQTEGRMSGVH